ncbi:MAG: 50S ribosomal protein L18 [Gammaproteobacteria bacterium AqS3]|nr:50S ribosomal protein L18 [Gammaproteobacteria bacterium AqS3]
MSGNSKQIARLRRARRGRAKIRQLAMPRLSVFRSGRHIYAQVFSPNLERVLASASTLESGVGGGRNIASAAEVGERVAKRSLDAGIEAVAFDHSGYKYHGRIKALADGARGAGLKF